MTSKYRNRIAKRLSHTFYKYDYHIFWTPKYRYKMLEGKISSQLSRDIHALSLKKDVEVEELNIQSDHVHPLCLIPLKLAISGFIGFLKGKTAIKIIHSYLQLKKIDSRSFS